MNTVPNTIAASSNKNIRFSRDEINLAITEMNEKQTVISSIQRDGIFVGLTANADGTQYLSAYAEGFWLSLLYFAGSDMTFTFISVPGSLLYAINTEYADEARELAKRWSASYRLDETHWTVRKLCAQLDDFTQLLIDKKVITD